MQTRERNSPHRQEESKLREAYRSIPPCLLLSISSGFIRGQAMITSLRSHDDFANGHSRLVGQLTTLSSKAVSMDNGINTTPIQCCFWLAEARPIPACPQGSKIQSVVLNQSLTARQRYEVFVSQSKIFRHTKLRARKRQVHENDFFLTISIKHTYRTTNTPPDWVFSGMRQSYDLRLNKIIHLPYMIRYSCK